MINNYNIIKKLGKGYNGISYLIEKSGKKFVLKRQKLLSNEIKPNFKYLVWREIDFIKFVNKLSKNKQIFFMKMYNYEIIECAYKHKSKYIPPEHKKELIKRNNSKHCLDILLEYKGNTVYKLIKSTKLQLKEKYSLIIQLLYALNEIRQKGYIHQDVHPGNITYRQTDLPIKIGRYKLDCKYQYSLIDYGEVKHIKYAQNKKEREYIKKDIKYNNDVYQLIYQIILQQYLHIYTHIDNKKPLPDFDYEKNLFNMYEHTEIWNKIKYLLIKKNKKLNSEWFKSYEKYNMILKKHKSNWMVTEDIEFLFSAYNRKLYSKIFGWKIIISGGRNFIPAADIEYMILHTDDNNKLIKYFINKLNKIII